ncbi:MAG: hypothetical protein ACJ75B_10145 [Flavisolibacter sp.]
MEKIQALIDKLYQQKQQNAQPAQLLLTVQLLQSELFKLQQKNGTIEIGKVSVTMPISLNFDEVESDDADTHIEATPVPQMPTIKPAAVVEDAPSFIAAEPIRPMVREEIPVRETAYSQPLMNPAFSTSVESPTLSQYESKRELHEVIAEKKESLNDRLKQEKKEVVHTLKETPIRDLRKGIGINDRFTFVNELFRGDDAMYERSIKTINGFHIFSEAEYWINRELKFKLGWNDSKETVQLFYQLVRRRFS